MCGAPENDGAGFTGRHTGEFNQFVFPDYDFLDEVAGSEFDEFGMVEGACDFSASDKCKTLDAVEISVFN
jgi:hypothetical protein